MTNLFICDIHRLLNLSLTSDLVPDQDVIDVIIHVGRNPLGRHLAWRYFREKWDILNSRWMWLYSFLFISDFNLPLSPWYEFHIRTLIRYLFVNVILCLVCVWRTESIMGNICWCFLLLCSLEMCSSVLITVSIFGRYGEALFMNSKLISGVTEFLNTEAELNEVRLNFYIILRLVHL